MHELILESYQVREYSRSRSYCALSFSKKSHGALEAEAELDCIGLPGAVIVTRVPAGALEGQNADRNCQGYERQGFF